jgi:predicted RNase H-like HicB family nuclease
VTDYHINVFFSKKDGGYIADIPDLRFCSAFGETPEEALHEVLIAKKAWIETARASGKAVPKPRYQPAIYRVAS